MRASTAQSGAHSEVLKAERGLDRRHSHKSEEEINQHDVLLMPKMRTLRYS
jgi:hypothetical protein